MKIDFHFGIIYILAKSAGFKPEYAYEVAFSSQYVDDAKEYEEIPSAEDFEQIVSSHETLDPENFMVEDGMEVWVPFHFVPGCVGKDLIEFFRTKPDSKIINEIIDNEIIPADVKREDKHIMFGIALHPYADTWAHQDFAGLNSRDNIDDLNNAKKIYEEKNIFKKSIDIIKNLTLNKFPTGHGNVETNPDLPFLKYNYRNITKTLVPIRSNNPSRYIDASLKIYEKMHEFLKANPTYAKDPDNIKLKNDEIMINALENFFRETNPCEHKRCKIYLESSGNDGVEYNEERFIQEACENFEKSMWLKWQKSAHKYRTTFHTKLNHHVSDFLANNSFYNPNFHKILNSKKK